MLAKTEVNTGRQVELDYMKGLFVPMILLIHAFQMLGGPDAMVPAYQITYMIATMTGAAIFMFVLGVGSVYSKKSDKALLSYGVKLIIMEFVWNALTLALPMILGQLLRMLFGAVPNWAETWLRIPVMLQYINVFFIAGMCYFVIVLCRKLKVPTVVYFILAAVLFVVNPYLYMLGKTTGNVVADYILTTFVGGRDAVSLTFITFLPHALLGVGFGKILRRTENKGRLYGVLAAPLATIVIAYFIYAVKTHPDFASLYLYSDMGYTFPDAFRAFANASSVLLLAGLLYALRNLIGKCTPLHKVIMQFCKNNTPYYAIHPFYYCTILAAAAYVPFSAGFCTLMAFVVGALCFGTILLWNRLKKNKS
ncbi:MAG: hypothetical protein IJC78_05800 [Clostridia bacterium]|nr:hypothetical protein [Clostridia bacterium]